MARTMFRRVTSRQPTSAELQILSDLYQEQIQAFREDHVASDQVSRWGEASRPADLPADELAAWTTVASTILCLDEAVMRN